MDNKTNFFKTLIIILGLITSVISVYAQETGTTKITRPVQVTFIHPLGTNGWNAPKVVNKISINLLAGVSAGTQGFEFGGLVNVDLGNVKGAQIAGLVNTNTGSVKGFQFAGLANTVTGGFNGFQTAGIYNFVKYNSTGFQFAGIANVNLQDSKGAYIAGLTNVFNGDSRGFLLAGLANVNNGNMSGTQIAGLTNVAVGTSKTQIAGLTNIGVQPTTGLQLAGLVNVSPKDHKGTQIAGLVNYTRTLSGFQLALINVADTITKGVPIGFISVVAHGYRRFEFEGNEVLYANLNFKTGTTKFYNIFSVGYRPENDKQNWGVTYGIGTLAPISSRFNFNFDITATHLNEGEAWTDELNLLNRFKFNIAYLITNRLEIFGGPSLNIAVSKLKNSEGEIVGSSLIPSYTFYDETISDTNVKMYVGFNIGLRF